MAAMVISIPALGQNLNELSAEEKTEGWVTGLRLSALSLRHRGDLERLLRSLPENIHYITDYLMTEVLSRQSPAV